MTESNLIIYDSSDDDEPLSLRVRQVCETTQDDSSDDDKPLSLRVRPQNSVTTEDYSSDDDKPLSLRVRPQDSVTTEDDSSDDDKPLSLRIRQNPLASSSVMSSKKRPASDNSSLQTPTKKSKVCDAKKSKQKSEKTGKSSENAESTKALPQQEKTKWTTLVHNGVKFPPLYTPHGVKMLYDAKPVSLTPEQEEVATMYAKMLETDYVKMPVFNANFFEEWSKILGKKHVIQDFKKCDFRPIHHWLKQVAFEAKEKRKQMSSEEKAALKLESEKEKENDKCGWAFVDGVKEKYAPVTVEPPGLFRGLGDCPKLGRVKKRILPSDVTINIGKDAPIPECPIPGQRWKEVVHNDTVTWLARWDDPCKPGQFKYVWLGAGSNMKADKDREKYQKARELKEHIDSIRKSYSKDFKSKDVTRKQTAVATYLIDRLALRAGNEKDDDEADTCGCCTLKVENVKPIPPNTLEFDFLGKDSIRFYLKFEADILVFKAIEQLRKGKQPQDQLFDKLDTAKLNVQLKKFMPGLTAKVFRTFHASMTLDKLLSEGVPSGDLKQKLDFYRDANKEVAILCNHQRSVPKSHNTTMEKRTERIKQLKIARSELQKELDQAKLGKPSPGKKRSFTTEVLENKIIKADEKIRQLEHEIKLKEEMKTIALNTSKTNYLDPRITVSWCKRNEVPIEKIFSQTYRDKFSWAMDVEPTYRF